MIVRLARLLLALLLPLLLVVLSVRLVMTPLFLQAEYQRSGFPADPYGLTTGERLTYAPLALRYLIEGQPDSFLGELTFDTGAPLFNIRELGHMHDVQQVTHFAFAIAWAAGAIALLCVVVLARSNRRALASALRLGGLLALGLVAAVAVTAVVAWDAFFTLFHQLFFAGGTWVFAYSDSLIRLFPEQFWFDAALWVGGLTSAGAFVLLALAWRLDHVKQA